MYASLVLELGNHDVVDNMNNPVAGNKVSIGDHGQHAFYLAQPLLVFDNLSRDFVPDALCAATVGVGHDNRLRAKQVIEHKCLADDSVEGQKVSKLTIAIENFLRKIFDSGKVIIPMGQRGSMFWSK